MPDVVKLNLRLPKDLHRKLEQAAKRKGVSLNTQIIDHLRGPAPSLRAIIKETADEAATSTLRFINQRSVELDEEKDK